MATRKSVPAAVVVPPSVGPQRGQELLRDLISRAEALKAMQAIDGSEVAPWRTYARDVLTRVFGSTSPNISAVINAGQAFFASTSPHQISEQYRDELTAKIKQLGACIDQLQLDIDHLPATPVVAPAPPVEARSASRRVFVVHGRNMGIKETVARYLERLELKPVVLHEQPNRGRTIINKFTDYSDVSFAVVLMTSDDEGRLRNSSDELKPRARENVILELGYFLGKLSSSNVCVLYEPGTTVPSDYAGVIFVPLDEHGNWRLQLCRELRASGLRIDANLMFDDA